MRTLVLLFLTCIAVSAQKGQPSLSEPALAPDHSEIAFISGGDIWTVPFQGGEARLLVSNPATESRPMYSPDGSMLAFNSTRTGTGDIYVLQLKSGELKRITFDDSRSLLDGWSADGRYLYFSSNRNDIAGTNDIYRIPVAGGSAVAVAADRYMDESQAAPNPANGTIAFVNGGMAVNQWWRKGHAHIDETRLIAVTPGAMPKYETLLENSAKNLWPMWTPDGRTLFFMSDKSGVENIWKLAVGGAPKQVTSFTDGRVLWPQMSHDGRAIVFERNFRIYKTNLDGTQCEPVAITLRGTPAGPTSTHMSLTTGLSDLAVSKDGKKVAFSAHGEVFAASAKDGGDGVRITRTPADEKDLSWSPDNRRLLYLSDRDGADHLYAYDLSKEAEVQLTSAGRADSSPVWSPDGKQIAYIHDGRELHVLKVETKEDKVLASRQMRTIGTRGRTIAWSPGGEWLAFVAADARGFENIALVPAAGGAEIPATWLANGSTVGLLWSPTGNFLLFNSGQRTENHSIARVDLIPRTPMFKEDEFRNLFHDELVKPPAKALEVVSAGIRQRLSLLPLGLDTRAPIISPDGKTLLFAADAGGQENLYTYSLDELAKTPAVPRQLTSTAARKTNAQFSPDGKDVFYIEGGKVNVVTIESRVVKPLAVTAELDVDFDAEKKEVFHQAWSTLNDTYYDPKFHGANWSDMRGQFQPFVDGAKTPDEVRRVIGLMIGELNSSHSGISAGAAAAKPPSTGRLGFDYNPADNTISAVVPLGPADVAGIKAGEKLLSIDGTAVNGSVNIDELLQYKIGKRTLVSTSAHPNLAILPANTVTEKKLLYRQWVEANRAYVNKLSAGRLGYVHMQDMSAGALDQLQLDLDSENQTREGVVVDIRNNNGGFVNAYALDVFSRRPYLTMTTRDNPSSSARSMLGQRSLERPTVLVVNQNSLSDAEDFTEGYRELKLGKVVGVPTAGWIIYTSAAEMIDGSALRTPQTKITSNDGVDMELHPRPVDLEVKQAMGESYSGRDSQLEAAVKSLLGSLGASAQGGVKVSHGN